MRLRASGSRGAGRERLRPRRGSVAAAPTEGCRRDSLHQNLRAQRTKDAALSFLCATTRVENETINTSQDTSWLKCQAFIRSAAEDGTTDSHSSAALLETPTRSKRRSDETLNSLPNFAGKAQSKVHFLETRQICRLEKCPAAARASHRMILKGDLSSDVPRYGRRNSPSKSSGKDPLQPRVALSHRTAPSQTVILDSLHLVET